MLLALLLAAAGLLYGSRRLARRLVIALALAFLAICILPIGDLMILPLENRFPKSRTSCRRRWTASSSSAAPK